MFLWMLLLASLPGPGLGNSVEAYSTFVQPEREAEFLYVGDLYRDAFGHSCLSLPSGNKFNPSHLEHLLQDPHYVAVQRSLRPLETEGA